MSSQVIDFDDATAKRTVLSRMGALRGRYRVEVVRFRPRRNNKQNSLYWVGYVQPFAQWLSEQEPGGVPDDHAHGLLKAQFLTVEHIDKATGESIGKRVRSTTELTTVEFADYLDRCAAWMGEFGIFVQPRKEGENYR